MEYYARLVRVEGHLGYRKQLHLDAVDVAAVERFLPSRDRVGLLEASPVSGVVLWVQGGEDELRHLVGVDEPLSVGSWFRLRLGEAGYPALQAANENLAVDGTPTYIASWSQLSSETSEALTELFRLDGTYRASTQTGTYGRAANYWVACMNVGQGNCVAVMSNEHDRPIAYLDFGFPTMPLTRTAPLNQTAHANHPRFSRLPLSEKRDPHACICDHPILLFTHWDWDHWYQAEMLRKRFADFPLHVIAPDMPALRSPTAHNFWKQISPLKRSLFPVSGWLAFDWGYAVRCTGSPSDKNQGGVAAFVRIQASQDDVAVGLAREGVPVDSPTFLDDEGYVLVPGDAHFGNIPLVDTANLVGLVATHHGADEGFGAGVSNVPAPSLGNHVSPVAYSYGLADAAAIPPGQDYTYRTVRSGVSPHSGQRWYGHPRPDAIVAYRNAGWNRRLDTAAARTPLVVTRVAAVGHLKFESPFVPGTRKTACIGANGCSGWTTMEACHG